MTFAVLAETPAASLPGPLFSWHTALRGPVCETGEGMTAGEQMFFLGAPLAHVLEYECNLRFRRNCESRNASRLSRVGLRSA